MAKPPVDRRSSGQPAQSASVKILSPIEAEPETQASRHSTSDIAKNSLHCLIVSGSRLRQVLAHLVNSKGQVRTCQSEVLETPNKTPVLENILRAQRLALISRHFVGSRHGSSNSPTLLHVGPVQEIKSIFVLRQNQTLRIISGLNTKEILQAPKVLDRKRTRKSGNQFLNSSRRGPSQNNIVNIDKHIYNNPMMIKDEHIGIGPASNKTELMKLVTQTGIPGTGRLFEPIDGPLKFADMRGIGVILKPWGLLHIHIFGQKSV